jgi:universal stress protein A
MAYRRVLCAVDFSDHSNTAFYRAIEVAEKFSASLMLLHAVEVHPLSSWTTPEGLSDLTLEIEGKAREAMSSLVEPVAGRLDALNVRTEITSGPASTEILENARVWKADLIVIGARGVGALEDVPLGSTVDRVVSGSECSVLVVKA